MLPGGEIFQALEKGAIDATEFSLPVMDESLGFSRVAKNNYYPGWHQPFTAVHAVINQDYWGELGSVDKAQFEQVCTAVTTRTLAASEARQGAVIAGFPAIGVKARSLDETILRELQRLSVEVMDEEAQRDPDFATILQSQRDFSTRYLLWKRAGLFAA